MSTKYVRVVMAIEETEYDEFKERLEMACESDDLNEPAILELVKGYYVSDLYSTRDQAVHNPWKQTNMWD